VATNVLFDKGAQGWNYAITLGYGKNNGKVIVAGNSGICGNSTPQSKYPAPGEIGTPDNQQFPINCLAYLGG